MRILSKKLTMIATAIASIAVILFYVLETRGWDSAIKTEYSPAIRPSKISEVSEITLQRYGCFGTCPVYTVTFKKNGEAKYVGLPNHTGIQNWHKIGTYSGQTSEFMSLATWIESQHFFEMNEKCGHGATDTEVVAVTVVAKEGGKNVTVCDSSKASAELQTVYSAIDEAASRVKWHKEF